MLKVVSYILTGILSSFYLFPIEFKFMPGVNTKMVMAAVGVLLFLCDTAKKRTAVFDRGLVNIIILGFVVSAIGFLSTTINNTRDYTYATYFISMFVWLGGAYTLLKTIHTVHNGISVTLVCNYLIAVCVGQCVSALLIEFVPSFEQFIGRIVLGVGFALDFEDLQGYRMYGIGAILDVAGQRFSAILMIIGWLVTRKEIQESKLQMSVYLISFAFITVIGNMIGRTTIVGALVTIAFWFGMFVYKNSKVRKPLAVLTILLLICIPFTIELYNTYPVFAQKLQFGFEGFFNLVTNGHWETQSTNILKTMYRFPDNAHTWLIGDGYFENPTNDPLYVGQIWHGFYMGTDVGYLRFIYYFGIFGLLAFILYFIAAGSYLAKTFPEYKVMFWGIVMLNFIIWLKVSSDLFSVLALFILIPYLRKLSDTTPVETDLTPHE